MKKLKIKIILLCLCLFISYFSIFTIDTSIARDNNTIYVGEGADYETIQEGIDAALEGWTVDVDSGVYVEYITINKTIWLKGSGWENTIINVNSKDADRDVVTINVSGVTLTGFTIKNGGYILGEIYGGIRVEADGCTISNNNISKNDRFGIFLIDSSGHTVTQNIITNHSGRALRLLNVADSHFSENHIFDNADVGISLYQSTGNTFVENVINNNSVGFEAYDVNSINNVIYHNNFMSNTQNAYDIGTNTWDNEYPSGGNYWSNYLGSDEPPMDGIGDSPYEIPGDSNQDEYPLMYPYGSDPPLFISAPAYVNENVSFEAVISSYEELIEDATVFFNDHEYNTDAEGKVEIIAPMVIENTEFIIEAEKENYLSAAMSIIIIDEPTSLLFPPLNIESPTSVFEGAEFTLSVNAGNEPIEGVTIEFNSNTYTTEQNGEITLQAPEIEEDTEFIISAIKQHHPSDETTILVINQVESTSNGIIYGFVVKSSTEPLKNAEVCANQDGLIQCIDTDVSGNYYLSVPSGIYTITASKRGYLSSTAYNIEVVDENSVEVNFILETESMEDENQEQINEAIEEGNVGGEFTIILTEEEEIEIDETLYSEITFSPSIDKLNKKILLVVDGQVSTGKTLIINMQNNLNDDFLDLNSEIIVEYDGKGIDSAKNLTDVLNASDDGSLPEYYIVEDTLFVSVPHFSEHTITVQWIAETVKALGGIKAIITYVLICAAVAIVFIGTIQIRRKI